MMLWLVCIPQTSVLPFHILVVSSVLTSVIPCYSMLFKSSVVHVIIYI